jgi:hypothetical protein
MTFIGELALEEKGDMVADMGLSRKVGWLVKCGARGN